MRKASWRVCKYPLNNFARSFSLSNKITIKRRTQSKSNIVITQTPNNAKITETKEKPIRILTLGDSYTVGEGVDESESWPALLYKALSVEGHSLEKPTIIAQTGWTTGDLLAVLQNAKPQGLFDLVTLLIGVNNQYQGGDIEIYQAEFRELLGVATRFTGGYPSKVLVMSIPDWGGTTFNQDYDPFQISAEIDQFNIINKKVCLATGSQYLNITPISREVVDDPAMLAADGLHPSRKMYSIWMKAMLPTVHQILQAA